MKNSSGRKPGNFRFTDFLIIIIFLAIAAFSVNLFRQDLMHTINLQNVEPVGTVVIKKNTVQRRHSDRVLWDRLAYESPVYIGDVIRVAEISAATLHLQGNSLDLEENTLIRIMLSPDGEGIQIILSEGNISAATGRESAPLSIDLEGRQLQAGRGAVLSAAAGGNGRVSFQVNEGTARLVQEGREARNINSGNAVTMDAYGYELLQKKAVVTQPAPNARFVKGIEPLIIRFSWTKINIPSDGTFTLEISSDRNFTRIVSRYGNLDRSILASFEGGFWYWRLLFENEILSSGSLTVAEGAGPDLVSPAMNSLFRYEGEPPLVSFRWTEIAEAVSYTIEVSSSADFTSPRIQKQVSGAFLSENSLTEGTWYWRVKPLFPSVFGGISEFSKTSFFRISRNAPVTAVPSLSDWLSSETSSFSQLPPEVPPELIPEELLPPPPLPVLSLSSPAQGAQIEGLTALRQQTVFRWNADGNFSNSRFVLSRNANPLRQPERQVQNPAQTVRLDNLGEGTWYWTVELQTENGRTVSAPVRRIQVLPIPLLPAAANLRPVNGTTFTHEQLVNRTTMNFSWAAVRGANAYILTLSQQSAGGTRRIMQTAINSGTSYTLQSLRVLDKGTFIWQVEAVNTRGSVIEQRGRPAESSFILDFNLPGPVQIEDTGILYGN